MSHSLSSLDVPLIYIFMFIIYVKIYFTRIKEWCDLCRRVSCMNQEIKSGSHPYPPELQAGTCPAFKLSINHTEYHPKEILAARISKADL